MRALQWSMVVLLSLVMVTGCGMGDKNKVGTTPAKDSAAKTEMENAKPAPPPQILADTYVAAGRMLEEQGDFRNAIAQYEKAIAANPRLAGAYNQLGMLYQKVGRLPDAELIYRRGIQADPSAAILCNNLGYCYLIQDRYADAEREFREALRLAPDFARARMNLAIALASMEQDQESLDEFSAVVSKDAACFNLAMIRMAKRRYAAAEAALLQALAINPECPGAKTQLEKVRALARGSQPASPAPADASTLAGQPGDPGEPKTSD